MYLRLLRSEVQGSEDTVSTSTMSLRRIRPIHVYQNIYIDKVHSTNCNQSRSNKTIQRRIHNIYVAVVQTYIPAFSRLFSVNRCSKPYVCTIRRRSASRRPARTPLPTRLCRHSSRSTRINEAL